MKKVIKKIFSFFGLEIRRLPLVVSSEIPKLPSVQYKNFEITSPLEHNTEKRMNDFFSDAKIVEQYLDPSRQEFYNLVIETAKKNYVDFNVKSIADIGCGTGHLLAFLNNQFPESIYFGFDFSESALLIAEKTLPKASFKKTNIYEKLNEKFDIVICTEVLEHLTDPNTAFLNLMESLKIACACILSVPNGRKDNYEGHINFWSPESWKIFIERLAPQGSFVVAGELENGTDLFAIIKVLNYSS